MLRRNILIGSFELNFVAIDLVFVTFFLDEKSNQKNQVLCINSIVFAKIPSAREKYSSAAPDFKQFSLRQTIFLQKLEFLQGTSEKTSHLE